MNKGKLVKVIAVHEAECLLPTDLIEAVVTKNIKEKVDLYDELVEFIRQDSRFAEFFDFKNGLTLREAISLDSKYGVFWLEILKIKPKFSSKSCISSRVCTDCGSCPAIDGFGDTLLRHAVDHLDSAHLKAPRFNLDEYLRSHWLELGRLLVSWGCVASGGSVRA